MKKIKVSEMPLCSSLRGLFTIGIDEDNNSVKVSLQFVEDEVVKAVSNAEKATAAAQKAADDTNLVISNAQKATLASSEATQAANTATANTNKAISDAEIATIAAQGATEETRKATQRTNAATTAAQEATAEAQRVTEETQMAKEETKRVTEEARSATADSIATLGMLVPSGLTVNCVKRITWGNVRPVYISSVLSPSSALRNLIYISDNKAVEVGTNGLVTPIAKGVSRVHVIPTMNTALARTLIIEVGEPTMRYVNLRSSLRLTHTGGLRFT